MLKVLLYVYVSLFTLASRAQSVSVTDDRPEAPEVKQVITDLLSTVSDNSRLTLSWKTVGSTPSYFAIERSDNGKNFEVVAVMNNHGTQSFFRWNDDAPPKGRSLYRIRYSSGDQDSLYSATIPVSIAGYIAFRFYPNPVDQILIVRSEAPVDVQIIDATGKMRISAQRIHGLQTINVSSLEKGIYLIRFSNKLTNVMSQEKLIKN